MRGEDVGWLGREELPRSEGKHLYPFPFACREQGSRKRARRTGRARSGVRAKGEMSARFDLILI